MECLEKSKRSSPDNQYKQPSYIKEHSRVRLVHSIGATVDSSRLCHHEDSHQKKEQVQTIDLNLSGLAEVEDGETLAD
ncbi:unnamed protein product [Angiostrongylus costaricensis]|uniref:NBPF n=1 Tax=Angiostrongylus costaricensis TaxID=334426 RepID=A0A0R3PKH5_ANGCS|nr:unnamed protein product [Angiostrongylus costaricensis]